MEAEGPHTMFTTFDPYARYVFSTRHKLESSGQGDFSRGDDTVGVAGREIYGAFS